MLLLSLLLALWPRLRCQSLESHRRDLVYDRELSVQAVDVGVLPLGGSCHGDDTGRRRSGCAGTRRAGATVQARAPGTRHLGGSHSLRRSDGVSYTDDSRKS